MSGGEWTDLRKNMDDYSSRMQRRVGITEKKIKIHTLKDEMNFCDSYIKQCQHY